jgi:hypothetical protein
MSNSEVRHHSVSSRSSLVPTATISARVESVGVANDDDDDSCVVCMCAKREVALVPCGHFILCFSCCHKLSTKKCPVCNAAFKEAIKIFR